MKYIDNRLKAKIVKLEDANNNYTSENVEGALEEIDSKIKNIEANGYDDTKIKQNINDIKTEIGSATLNTDAINIKDAINEVNARINTVEANAYDDTKIKQNINDIKTEIGTEELTTTDKTIKGAVNELDSQIKENENFQKNIGVNVYQFEGETFDEKFQNALESNYKEIIIPGGWHVINLPHKIPWNSSKTIRGAGGLKETVLNVNIPSGYEERGVIEYLRNDDGRPNYSGLNISDIQMLGNNSKCHGIYIQDTSYVHFNRVIIEGFDGAGLLLDKVQDSSFNNLILQLNGRTAGDRTLLTDRTDETKTLYSSLHIISTIKDDHTNMLRFNDCQIENNITSPYIWYKDTGGIGITFDKMHSEVRLSEEFGNFTCMRVEGGDISFANLALSDTFKNGFNFCGYGTYKFINSRNLNSINVGNNTYITIDISNCTLYDLNINSSYPNYMNTITNCAINSLNFSYPSGNQRISNCIIKSLTGRDVGSSDLDIKINNCCIDDVNLEGSISGISMINNTINNSLVFNAVNSRFIDNDIKCSSYTINLTNGSKQTFIPRHRVVYTENEMIYGSFYKGDKMYITSASNSGDVYCYLCIQDCDLNGAFNNNAFKPIITIQ